MEKYESAKLRMQCLELAQSIALASASGFYSIVTDAEKYWAFVEGDSKLDTPKKNDDIPF